MLSEYLDKMKENGDSFVFVEQPKHNDGTWRIVVEEDEMELQRIEDMIQGVDICRKVLSDRRDQLLKEMVTYNGQTLPGI